MFGLSKKANRLLIGSLAAVVLGAVFFVVVAIRFFSISRDSGMAGFEFGKVHDAQECLDEAIRRHTVTIDPTRQVGESAFVGPCLQRAKPSADFCQDVPAFNMINQGPAAAWAASKCNEKGFNDGGCRGIFIQVVAFCKMREESENSRKQQSIKGRGRPRPFSPLVTGHSSLVTKG